MEEDDSGHFRLPFSIENILHGIDFGISPKIPTKFFTDPSVDAGFRRFGTFLPIVRRPNDQLNFGSVAKRPIWSQIRWDRQNEQIWHSDEPNPAEKKKDLSIQNLITLSDARSAISPAAKLPMPKRAAGHPYLRRTPMVQKKPRTSFTKAQISALERRFAEQKYLASAERVPLAAQLRMQDAQVKTWFQNRRTKWRRQEAEERQFENKLRNALVKFS